MRVRTSPPSFARRNDSPDPRRDLDDEVRVDLVVHRRLAVEHFRAGGFEHLARLPPHSTPITGSSVPCPIATGGSGGDRSSSKPSTVGMNELNTVSAAGRGRPRPRPSEYVITPPCENPPNTSRSCPTPCSARKPSSHSDAAA